MQMFQEFVKNTFAERRLPLEGMHGVRIIVYGSGSVTSSVLIGLVESNYGGISDWCESVKIYLQARSPTSAGERIARVKRQDIRLNHLRLWSAEDIENTKANHYTILINATPLSLSP